MTGLERRRELRRTAIPRGTSRLARRVPLGPGAGELASVTRLVPRDANVVPLHPRTPMPLRATSMRRRGAGRREVRQDPGFPPDIKMGIFDRDRGQCVLQGWEGCGWEGCWGTLAAHHRQLVGMGGTSEPRVHVMSAGVVACEGHHVYWVHRHVLAAKVYGLIVPRANGGRPVSRERITFDRGVTWWLLTDDGRRIPWAPRPGGDDAA
jgi:hypothetical protein